MIYYKSEVKDVLKELKSDEKGLELSEAQKRLTEYGKNKLVEQKKASLISRFLKQLADPMIIILLAAAAISGITAISQKELPTDVFIILFVVILNSVLGVLQESKAEEAIEALKNMTATNSKVFRGGTLMSVKSEELTIGDIIFLEAGDSIPADGRIIEAAALKVEESALTGESVPSEKNANSIDSKENIALGDRKNMVYMGCNVVYGRAKAIITATGMNTEMGKIADALTNVKEEKTPLQQKLAKLSKTLTYLVLGICIFIFLFGFIKSGSFTPETALNTFMVAVSLAVAAIPEGLSAVVTIVLSIGVTKMSKRNAVIRRLTAVETLGCTQIICSDKTGTLTQNKMTVVEHSSESLSMLAVGMSLCTDSEIDTEGKVFGEPTEAALVVFALNNGFDKRKLKSEYPRVGELPFDSNRKMMSTLHKLSDGKIIQYTKGAPDEILKKCNRCILGNKEVEMSKSQVQAFNDINKEYADHALRVLALAYKPYNEIPADISIEALENDMIFVGMVGMIDPVRTEVFDAIRKCREAGIRPIMITGDHKDTAVAIATQLGILEGGYTAITGNELNSIDDERFLKDITKYSVYARVQPEHKVRIVNTWKQLGKITAMTGDGVNDAPSIKSADIGVGMGITGTDVTKNVADIILADDNFATIVTAVEEGRKIYDNIRKSIQFLLSSNLSEVIGIFFATVLGFTLLKPVHILWINLITDSLPALGLGMEQAEADVMKRKPREPNSGIFSDGVGKDVVYQGFLVAFLTLLAYFIGARIELGTWGISESNHGITMAFLTMSMAEIFHSFNLRSQRKSIFTVKGHNVYLYGAMILSLLLTTFVIYVPFASNLFGFTEIGIFEYLISLGTALSVIPIVELVKLIERRFNRK